MTEMDSAIARVQRLQNFDLAEATQPHSTTKAGLLDYAVRMGEYSEAQFLASTFSVIVECDSSRRERGPVLMTIKEDIDQLSKDFQRIFSLHREPESIMTEWCRSEPWMGYWSVNEDNIKASLRLLQSRQGKDKLTISLGWGES